MTKRKHYSDWTERAFRNLEAKHRDALDTWGTRRAELRLAKRTAKEVAAAEARKIAGALAREREAHTWLREVEAAMKAARR